MIPHVTDEIKAAIHRLATDDVDVVITEIGGTVGDIEGLPFLEAIRQFALDVGRENCLYIHLTLVPYLKAAAELKTKPTQHSVGALRQIGIQPDILICRTEVPISARRQGQDRPLLQRRSQGGDRGAGQAVQHLRGSAEPGQARARRHPRQAAGPARPARSNSREWSEMVDRIMNPKHEVRIAVVGKYMKHRDSYKSVYESLDHAGIAHRARVLVVRVEAEEVSARGAEALLGGVDGILVPGGFGMRGIEGKIEAIRYARTNQIPFFGICLGMQCAVIEFARSVLGLEDANSTEFDKTTDHPVIALMEEQLSVRAARGHDAAGGLALRAGARAAWPGGLTASTRSASGIATATSSTTPTARRSSEHGLVAIGHEPRRRPSSRSSSCPTTPGSWRCSSIPSSSRSRPRPIPSSATSSAPHSSGRERAGPAWSWTAKSRRREVNRRPDEACWRWRSSLEIG